MGSTYFAKLVFELDTSRQEQATNVDMSQPVTARRVLGQSLNSPADHCGLPDRGRSLTLPVSL